jgi:hypothetical protein
VGVGRQRLGLATTTSSSPSSAMAAASFGGCSSKARVGASPEGSGGASCPGGGAREAAERLDIGSDSRWYTTMHFWSFMGGHRARIL